MHTRTIVTVAALAGLALSACSDDSDAGPVTPAPAPSTAPATAARTPATSVAPTTAPEPTAPEPTAPEPTAPSTSPATTQPAPSSDLPTGLASGERFSVAGALAEVPNPDTERFEVSVGDIAAVSDLFGLTRPDSVADVDAVLDQWLLPLTFPGRPEYRDLPVWLPLTEPLFPLDVSLLAEAAEVAGWSVVDVDAYVHVVPDEPGYLLVTTGAFADEALVGLDEVAPGIVTTHDGEDFAFDPARISAFDRLGRPVRMARDGDRLAVSLATPTIETWLAGPGETLATDARLAAVATALDDAGVLAAQLFRHDFVLDPGQASREQYERLTAEFPVDAPFDTVGIGWAVGDDGEASTVLVYAPLGSPDVLAEQLAAVFADGVSLVTGQPLSATLGAVAPEIAVVGDVVTVTYRPEDRFWWSAVQAVQQRDVPFAYR